MQKQKQKKQEIKPEIKPSYVPPTKPENTKKEEKKVEVKAPSKKDVMKEREAIRKHLAIYSDGIMIRLRAPSGDNLKVVVDPQEKVKYLYNYVTSREEELGFEN